MSVTGTIETRITFTQCADAGILAGMPLNLATNWRDVFGVGTGVSQISRISAQTITLTASTPVTINLRALTDMMGSSFTDLAELRGLAIRAVSDEPTATITLGNEGSTDEWTGLLSVGSELTLPCSTIDEPAWIQVVVPGAAAIPVGATSKLLKLTPSAHDISLDLILIGSE